MNLGSRRLKGNRRVPGEEHSTLPHAARSSRPCKDMNEPLNAGLNTRDYTLCSRGCQCWHTYTVWGTGTIQYRPTRREGAL